MNKGAIKLTRTALGAEVPQYDDGLLTLLNRATFHSGGKGVFGVECPSLAGKPEAFFAGDLRDGSARCKVALQNPEQV